MKIDLVVHYVVLLIYIVSIYKKIVVVIRGLIFLLKKRKYIGIWDFLLISSVSKSMRWKPSSIISISIFNTQAPQIDDFPGILESSRFFCTFLK